jgi:hypothetical protein
MDLMRRAPSIGALLIYLASAIALFSSAWVDPLHRSAGGPGDAQLFMWMLGWVPYSIGHGLNPLFTDYLIYPSGANLFWTLIPILPGVVLAPVMAWLGPVAAYNLAITLALAGSAWCAYYAINAFVKDRLGSFLGGWLFGFSPYMLAHALGHINLVICMTPPLAMLLLAELLVWQRRGAWIPGLVLGLLGSAQLLTTPEILFTTGFIGGIGVVVLALMRWREVGRRVRHAAIGLAIAVAVFLPVAAVVLGFAFFGPDRVTGVVREQNIFVTDLLNFVIPTDVMLLAPAPLANFSHSWTGDAAEWNAYLGIPLLALLVYVTFRLWSNSLIRWAAIVAPLVALLSLGPYLHLAGSIHLHIPLPWLVLQPLPLFDNVLPARLMLYFYLLAAIGLAFFVREIRREMTGVKLQASWAWVAVCLIPLLPAVPWPSSPNPVPGFFTGSAVKRIPQGSVVLVAPFSTAPGFQKGPGQDSAAYPMLWQMESGMWFRMPEGGLIVPDVNGAPSGGRPPRSVTQSTMIAIQQGGPAPELTTGLRSQILSELNRWKVDTVVVGPMYNQAAMIEFFTALSGRPPQQVDGVFVWFSQANAVTAARSGAPAPAV